MNPTVSGNVKRLRKSSLVIYNVEMIQEKLFLYTLDMKYVRDLHRADDRVLSVSPQIHKNNRPFVGVVIILDKHKYCIPLSHPKEKHYSMKNDIDFSRIIVENKLIGVLNFNSMIPVNDSVVSRLNLKINPWDMESEKAYKKLCIKELDWIQKNQDAIIKKANKLYFMVTTGKANNNLMKRCLNFQRLESILANREKN